MPTCSTSISRLLFHSTSLLQVQGAKLELKQELVQRCIVSGVGQHLTQGCGWDQGRLSRAAVPTWRQQWTEQPHAPSPALSGPFQEAAPERLSRGSHPAHSPAHCAGSGSGRLTKDSLVAVLSTTEFQSMHIDMSETSHLQRLVLFLALFALHSSCRFRSGTFAALHARQSLCWGSAVAAVSNAKLFSCASSPTSPALQGNRPCVDPPWQALFQPQ